MDNANQVRCACTARHRTVQPDIKHFHTHAPMTWCAFPTPTSRMMSQTGVLDCCCPSACGDISERDSGSPDCCARRASYERVCFACLSGLHRVLRRPLHVSLIRARATRTVVLNTEVRQACHELATCLLHGSYLVPGAFCSQRWQLRPSSTSCTRSRWRQLAIAGAISWYAPICALTRRDFVCELRAVSGESLTRVRSIGPYHRLLAVGDAK